ncbi:MAG: aroE [Acidimicrobiia bacterium]|nr:aroE [Acidimicrobiia bacterium]
MIPSGTTRVAAVIGSPIRHSLSPTIHNAGFAAAGLDWTYLAFEVADGATAEALAGMRAFGIAGLSVTMPHKSAVARLVDVLTAEAADLAAVNCVTLLADGRLEGHNTDGAGFLDALAAETGFDPAGRRCVVFGAGGAARAVIRALGAGGASEVVVVNRSAEAAERAAALAPDSSRVAGPQAVASAVRSADLVVNATPVGMDGRSLPFDVDLLREGQLVADLIYHPACTPLLQAAATRGTVTVNGLGMLVHQAAHAWSRWTGQPAPLAAMARAAQAGLDHSD